MFWIGVLEVSDQLAIAAAVGLPAPRRAPSVSQIGPQGDGSMDGRYCSWNKFIRSGSIISLSVLFPDFVPQIQKYCV